VRKTALLIILSLLVSLFIYLFYRTEKTVINALFIQVFSVHEYAALKAAVTNLLPLNEAIIYSLPEGLWVFCITLTSKPFYLQFYNRRVHCTVIPLIFCIALEVLQLLHLTNGRFDFLDIWVSISFWMIANYFFDHKIEKQNIISPINARSMACFLSYGIVYLAHVLE
jgi:hypothetical protein